MDILTLRAELNSTNIERYVDTRILDIVPWIFDGNLEAFCAWRNRIKEQTGMESDSLYVVGSAATGFSMSPNKAGRAFRAMSTSSPDRSDVDLAIASEELFVAAWNTIVNLDRGFKYSAPGEFILRTRENIYWGHLGEKSIPRNTPASRQLLLLKTACTREPPFLGYPMSVRIYRRKVDLRGYQVWSVRKLRAVLNSEGAIL